MLEVRGAAKSYGDVRALAGVSLSAARGEVVGLIGPNGAGKTTLLSIICGLTRADEGEVLIEGRDVRSDASTRRLIGYAPQDTGVYDALTVRENLAFFAELAGINRRKVAERTRWAAELLGLTELEGRTAHALSGGERRRLHTAAALVGDAPLLLLDEPTVGADIVTRTRLIEAVNELAARGCAVLYTTHYLPEVEAMNARVVILDHGEIVAEGTHTELVAKYATAAVELTFDGPAPEVRHPTAVIELVGERLRATGGDITTLAADLLIAVGDDRDRVQSIEMLRPSLDSVFLAVTGRRYEGDRS